jgi:hypothetical protein
VGKLRDLRTNVRRLFAIGAACLIAAAISAPAASASGLSLDIQSQVNSAAQLAQQMTANARQTVSSGVAAAQDTAGSAVAGARQTMQTALAQTATLPSATTSQTSAVSPSAPPSSAGPSSPTSGPPSPPPGQGAMQPGTIAAAEGLAATIANDAGVAGSLPRQASAHALTAASALAPQPAGATGATQPRRPLSGPHRRTGSPPSRPRDRFAPRPVPAERPEASFVTSPRASVPITGAPASKRPTGRSVATGHVRGHHATQAAAPREADSTARALTADAPSSAVPPAGGAAGAAGGGSGQAPAAALLAAIALSLLIGPSGRRMSLELPPWRSAALALPPERPG